MKTFFSRFNFINTYTAGVKFTFFLALAFAIANTASFTLIPQVVRITVDSIIGDEPFSPTLTTYLKNIGDKDFLVEHLYLIALLILAISLFSSLCNYLARLNIALASEGFMLKLRTSLFKHIAKLPLSWHVSHQTGDIIQRLTSDTETVKKFTSLQLFEVLKVIFLIFFTFSLMFSMNTTLGFISAIFIPISLLFTYIFFGQISKKFLDADEKEGVLSSVVQENLTGVRVVRAFGREAFELKRFDLANEAFAKAWVKMGYTNGYYWGIGDCITSFQILTVVLFATFFAVDGKITSGEFIAFVSYNASLTWPIRSLGRMLVDMSKTFVAIDRIDYILKAKPETDCKNSLTPSISGKIQFKNVSFEYNKTEKVLKNLSFTINSGETIGILGATGSGKSTLIHLINRLYELPNDSDILIDDVSIKDISLSHLRKNIGLVLQEPFLFSRSVFDNIAITSDDLSLKDVKKVTKIASIDDSILNFKDGYNTIVGERGVTLSGGQKQRVAISRTLIQNTPIIIFDDSLSAVDTETDAKIRNSLKENLSSSTVILISHRLTTLMQADKILVLDNGEISDFDTHDELLKRNDIYKKIYDIQSID